MEEIKNAINERLKSPLVGTFTIYLVLFNWKILIHLFSDTQTTEKIEIIQGLIDKEGGPTIVAALIGMFLTMTLVPIAKFFYERIFAWFRLKIVEINVDRYTQIRKLEDLNGRDKIINVSKNKERAVEITNLANGTLRSLDEFLRTHGAGTGGPLLQFVSQVRSSSDQIMKTSGSIMSSMEDFNSRVN